MLTLDPPLGIINLAADTVSYIYISSHDTSLEKKLGKDILNVYNCLIENHLSLSYKKVEKQSGFLGFFFFGFFPSARLRETTPFISLSMLLASK